MNHINFNSNRTMQKCVKLNANKLVYHSTFLFGYRFKIAFLWYFFQVNKTAVGFMVPNQTKQNNVWIMMKSLLASYQRWSEHLEVDEPMPVESPVQAMKK